MVAGSYRRRRLSRQRRDLNQGEAAGYLINHRSRPNGPALPLFGRCGPPAIIPRVRRLLRSHLAAKHRSRVNNRRGDRLQGFLHSLQPAVQVVASTAVRQLSALTQSRNQVCVLILPRQISAVSPSFVRAFGSAPALSSRSIIVESPKSIDAA